MRTQAQKAVQVRAAVVLVGVEAAPRMRGAQPEEEALDAADRPVVVVMVAEVAVLAPEVLGPVVQVQVVGRPAPDRAAL